MEASLSKDGFTFTTLTVVGRGKTSYAINAQPVFGRDGAMLNDQSLEPRVIVVRALVTAQDNESYRAGMSALLGWAHERTVHEVRFTDNMADTFYGTIQRIEDEDERSNRQIVEIEIVCHDPYKYTESKSITANNAQRINVDTDFRVVPDEIELTFDGSTQARDFTLNNTTTGRRIRYQQSGTASGNTIRIRQKEDYIGYVESVNHIHDLNIAYSHFDEFDVLSGDQIVATPEPLSIKITYKGASL